MTRLPNHSIVAAATLFLAASSVADVGVAALYSRAMARLRRAPSIAARGVRRLARPIRLAPHQSFPRARLEQHLQRIGYYSNCPGERGCFARSKQSVTVWARYPELPDVAIGWHGDEVSWIGPAAGE